MSWSPYLGPDGREIDLQEWADLFEKRYEDLSMDSWWRRQTRISDEVEVSTVWLGLNHQWLDGPPLCWETMVFGSEHEGDPWRYSSRQLALDDHERIVAALRAGQNPYTYELPLILDLDKELEEDDRG